MLLNVARLVANILIIKWVTPEDLGVWNTIIIIQNYAIILTLGTTVGLNRELPFALGRKLNNIAEKIAETGLFISLCASTTILISLIIASFLYNDTSLKVSLVILGIVLSARFINMYFSTTFRTNQAFLLFSKINLFLTLLEVITLILPSELSYEGFLLRILIIEILKLFIFFIYRPFPVFPRFSKIAFLFLTKTGIPLFLSVYLSSIAETFKIGILKKFSTFQIVGLFSPALAIYSLSVMLPNVLGQFIFPKLSHDIGTGKDIEYLWNKVLKFALFNMVLVFPFIVLGWFFIPYFIKEIFPKYENGIFPAQVALISACFVPFKVIINLFISLKTWKILYPLAISKLIIFFLFQWFFTKNMDPLIGISYGVLCANVIYALLIVITGYNYVYQKKNVLIL